MNIKKLAVALKSFRLGRSSGALIVLGELTEKAIPLSLYLSTPGPMVFAQPLGPKNIPVDWICSARLGNIAFDELSTDDTETARLSLQEKIRHLEWNLFLPDVDEQVLTQHGVARITKLGSFGDFALRWHLGIPSIGYESISVEPAPFSRIINSVDLQRIFTTCKT